MTGKDLLDAVGAVDEELLEHCQELGKITAKDKILWFWHDRKHVSIAACVCMLSICILGGTCLRYNFSGAGGVLTNEAARGMDARSETKQPLPGTGGDLAKDTANETEQDSKEGSMGLPRDQDWPSADVFADDSSDMEGAEAKPKESDGADIVASEDNKPSQADETGNAEPPQADGTGNAGPPQADETGNAAPNYSKGITIEAVNKIAAGSLRPPEETPGAAEWSSAKEILAQNTVIVRGTVKKIRRFRAKGGRIDVCFSVVSVKIKETYRADGKGNPQKGKTYKVYLPDSWQAGSFGNSISKQFAKGSEVVLMPYVADAKTGIRKKGKFFAFLDVSDYYFDAKAAESHIFLKTKTGVLYDTRVYDIPHAGKKVTMGDIGNYIKKMLKQADLKKTMK